MVSGWISVRMWVLGWEREEETRRELGGDGKGSS